MTGIPTANEASYLTPEGGGVDYGKDIRNAYNAGDEHASRSSVTQGKNNCSPERSCYYRCIHAPQRYPEVSLLCSYSLYSDGLNAFNLGPFPHESIEMLIF